MKKQIRRIAAAGAVAGAAALALPFLSATHVSAMPTEGEDGTHVTAPRTDGEGKPGGTHRAAGGWVPVTRGLGEEPGRVLPKVVSRERPVRVVSTSVDETGRPVVVTRTATDRDAAVALVRRAQQTPGAVSVETDAPVRVVGLVAGDVAASSPGDGDLAASGLGDGGDPYRGLQWDLARSGAPAVWERSSGAGVTVAVVDTGVDSSHPDLAGQVLVGGDFITGTEGAAVDPNGHGTHVAGTIAALAGNGVGVAGLAPGAKILPVRVLAANGGGYMSTAANGVIYATERGADVINLSISASTQSEAMTNAIAYAQSKGVVIVAAAGNTRAQGSPVSYPAADPGVIAVAATDSTDTIAGYSNRGPYVDVAAPGSDIVSTFPGGDYRRMSGTSMASPHVAALAALVKSAGPALGPDQVEQIIESTAVDLGAPGRDDDFGTGRIDASAAVDAALPKPAPPTSTPSDTPTSAPTDQPTQAPAPTPEASTPSTPTTPAPTTPTPTPTPTAEAPTTQAPAPAPTTQTPTQTQTPTEEPTTSAPAPDTRAQAQPMLVKTGPTNLLIAIRNADGQLTDLQRETATGWETVRSFPAVVTTELDAVTPGRYRVVLHDNGRYRGAVSSTAQL